MGFWGHLWKKAKKSAHTAFTRKGVFGRKGIIGSGRIFTRKGVREASKWTRGAAHTAGQALDHVDDLANKIEALPGVGILAKPVTTAVKGATETARFAGGQVGGAAHLIGGIGKKHHGRARKHGRAIVKDAHEARQDVSKAKRDLEARIAAVRGKLHA